MPTMSKSKTSPIWATRSASINLALVCHSWYSIVKHELYKSLVIEPKKTKVRPCHMALKSAVNCRRRHAAQGHTPLSRDATLIDVIRGLGVHHHRLPNLCSILIMTCDGYTEFPRLISTYLLQLFPHVFSVTPITSGSLSTVPANIYYNLIVMLAASISKITVDGFILRSIPHVHFQNLTSIRIIDPSEGTASRNYAHCIGSLVILDDANKLQRLNPKLVRNIREFCISDSQRTQIPVLDKNGFFIKIFDIPAKLNKVTLSLPQSDFPPIKDAKWPMLRSLRLVARSIPLQSIEILMTQLPRMHTLDLSMSHSDQQASDEVVCSRRTPLSTSVLVFGLKIAFPTLRDKTWLLMATRRLPELYKLVLSERFKVDKAALRRVYKNGLAFV
ncbi:hypothetical protein DL89DRAFT_267013 [Linderina pennispora]|uniref:F-box domain-containing protein n=1 Tax=Linderina pennispora TaxID=61395 RepID=A0A1Y1WCP3_9FUNG|nr:uncharacterized protein DL89DRAFT_267013 [Linderina pennispora]ORX70914.1 hypothetical protein DL89DRAFT_267013 [Linderina pennispora]